MQTLRKKNSPCKFKKEPTRFLGEGVSFKAKLIGILEVSEARGDRMCQAALADLKMAIRAAGEHKQRIAVQVSIDGLRLRDEKTGECLYHHPVHKISFIAQDMSDSRAFGYIFGSPDTGHRFFGIKTDKAANQVVIAMRDLFQVVFELKKKEIELTKQNIEQNASKFHISGIFVEPAPDTKGAAGTESCLQRIRRTSLDVDKGSSNSSVNDKKNDGQTGVIADLLDLQFELNSLQQGIHQMDKITPDNPRPSSEDPFETDPFGDSFANIKVKTSVQPILPPPPATSKRGHLERQQTVPATPSSATSSPAAQPVLSGKTSPPQESIEWMDNESEKRFSDGEIASLTNTGNADEENGSSETGTSVRKSPQIDVFTELDPLGTGLSKPYIDKKYFFQHLKNPPKKVLKDLVTTNSSDTFPTNFDISLDSLDPIKVRNGGGGQNSSETFEDGGFANFERFENESLAKEVAEATGVPPATTALSSRTDSSQNLTNNRSNQRTIHHQPLSVSLPPEESPVHEKSFNLNNTAPPNSSSTPRMDKESSDFIQSLMRLPSPKKYRSPRLTKECDAESTSVSRLRKSIDKPFPVDFSNTNESPVASLRSCSSEANSRLSSSSAELDIVPEPPPRGAGSIFINPPPLPPKKQSVRGGGKPPPRPPHTDSHLHYDFIEKEESAGAVSPSPTKRESTMSPARTEDNQQRFDDNFSPPSPHTLRPGETSSGRVSSSRFETMTPTTLSTLFRNPYMSNVSGDSKRITTTTNSTIATRPSLDITLSQLTSSNLAEFATSLDMSVAELSSLTLQQLTECLARLSAHETNQPTASQQPFSKPAPSKTPPPTARPVETSFVSCEPLFQADFDQAPKRPSEQPEQEQPAYDKYAVFRELLEMEQRKEDTPSSEVHDSIESDSHPESPARHDETASKLSTDETADKEDEPTRLTGVLSTCDSSVELAPLDVPSPKREFKAGSKPRNRSDASDDDDERADDFRDTKSSIEHRRSTIDKADEEDPSAQNSNEDYEDNGKLLDKHETEITLSGQKSPRVKIARGQEGETEDQGDREEEMEEDDDDEDEEDEDEDEDEEETVATKSVAATKISTNVHLVTLLTDTKDRYAALREIVDDPESAVASKDAFEAESTPSTADASTIQRQSTKGLAEQDLLTLFTEPGAESPSPRRSTTRSEDEPTSTSADIFEEIRMLNNSSSDAMICRSGKSTVGAVVTTTSTTTGFEDVFCPFAESKASRHGRESAGSVKDESNWAKFESSAVFHSDKSSYEGAGSVGGTSPWSPDEKDFQMESGIVGGKTATLMKGHYQQRLHSGESDNEWKDDEESEESNGKRHLRDESGFWCVRHPRFEAPDEAGPCYEERSDRADKDRHFRERGTRKLRGGPWPKQPSAHRTRDSSPWHEEPPRWSRDEDEAHHGHPRGRYPPSRKQTSAPYKDELEEPSKAYWKCRSKQRAWNGDREAFRNTVQQPPQSQQTPQHFVTEPIFYEDDRTKRRMILWGEDDRDRDRFSSQESMAYEDEERWSRREYDRRRERWDDEATGGGRFWPRRPIPTEADSRLDPRLDPRSEYGPPIGHEVCRKQHYCRGDPRDLRERTTGHDLYVPGSGPAGCWPEDDYSLPLPDRPENSPRYLTRKRHWPKRPNSANDERNLSETPVYGDSRFKYGMSRSECSDNDYEPSYHRPYRSRSRESYWGSDQEFESWPTGGSGSERLYWSEGPDAKSETLHRRRMNRHKTNRAASQKSQNSPFEDDFTETIDHNEASFDSHPDPHAILGITADAKQASSERHAKEHPSKELQRAGAIRCPKQLQAGTTTRGPDYFENETITSDHQQQALNERARNSAELKSTPEDFPSDMDKGSIGGDVTADNNGSEAKDSFVNGGPSPGFDEDAFAFKSEMADSVPETTPTAGGSSKNSRQIKYGNNKMKSDHDIKKSESVNIFVRESDPFDDDDFFK